MSLLSPSLYAGFVAATVLLMLVPGPNVALIVANSLVFGARVGLVTVFGTIVGMIVQLSVAALGVTALFGALAEGFNTLRWLGVVYLLWLGVRDWRTPAGDSDVRVRADPGHGRGGTGGDGERGPGG